MRPRVKWTEEMISILKDRYPIIGSRVSEELGIGTSSAKDKAASLGIKIDRVKARAYRTQFSSSKIQVPLDRVGAAFENFTLKQHHTIVEGE